MSEGEVQVAVAATPETPRVQNAKLAAALAYFTDPARLVEWMGSVAALDPVPGGEFRLAYGDGFAVARTYLEVDVPRRVTFTWGWAHEDAVPAGHGDSVLLPEILPAGSTRVTVTVDNEDGRTRVTLVHHDLPTAELVEGHRVARETYLHRLRIRAAGGDPGPDPHG